MSRPPEVALTGIVLAIIIAFVTSARPARGQAQAVPELSSINYTNLAITLGGDSDNLDWIKWGYPIIDDDGPFDAQGFAARATMTGNLRLRQTRKVGGGAIGPLSTVLPAGASTSEPFWRYLPSGGARFSWSGGVPSATSPTDIEVSGGIAILPGTPAPRHRGWGFELQVAAVPALRTLALYVDCPPNPESPAGPQSTYATVKARLGTLPERTTSVCRESNRRVQKVEVNFSTDRDVPTGSLSVSLTSEDDVGITRPIVLLAATLQVARKSGGGGGGGGSGGGGSGAAGSGPGDDDRTTPDRPTACAVGSAPRGNVLPIDLAAALFMLALCARRRSPR